MFVITSKPNNDIAAIGNEYIFEPNGDPFIPEFNVAFSLANFDIYELDEIPEEVVISKYCYTPEDGFYKNPDYVEINNSYGLPNEVYDAIRDEAVAQIESEVAGNADE